MFTLSITVFTACKKDYLEEASENSEALSSRKSNSVMDISYDMVTTINYTASVMELDNLDLATVTPQNEKQHIELSIDNSGVVNMTITDLDFKKKYVVPSHIPQGDYPIVVKTIISGNTLTTYDKNNKKISSTSINMPNRMDIVEKVMQLGEKYSYDDINTAIATMQGINYIDNLEEFIANAGQNNVQVARDANNLLTLSMPMNTVDKNAKPNYRLVVLVDESRNRMVGSRIYDEKNNAIQTTYLAFSKGKNEHIKAVRTIQNIALPSGKKTKLISTSEITDFKLILNTK